MANTTSPRSSIYNGWFYDAVTPAMKYYNRGTLVLTTDTAALTMAGTLATGAATLATGATTGDHEFSNTITVSDGVGSGTEQLTSGGASAACDWSLA